MSLSKKIENYWYSKHFSRWIFWPLTVPFVGVTQIKRWLYLSWLKPSKQSVPVIVVGNLSVGGTGKTPFIELLVKELSKRQIKVGIVSRGYRSNAPSYPHIVSEADDVKIVGDEAYMQFRKLGCPMAIGVNRSQVISDLIQNVDLDMIISDDGLQHYKMARDMEILLVDHTRGFGNALHLPFGPLRESVSREKSVDWVIQNGGNPLIRDLEHRESKTTIMQLKPTVLIHLKTDEKIALNNLKKQSVNAVCGIGNPQRFFNTLAPFCNVLYQHVFEDHHDFCEQDFKTLSDNNIVVMTEKDAVKCKSFAKDNWYYLKVEPVLHDKHQKELFALITNLVKQPKVNYRKDYSNSLYAEKTYG